jgi:hypothetical protein
MFLLKCRLLESRKNACYFWKTSPGFIVNLRYVILIINLQFTYTDFNTGAGSEHDLQKALFNKGTFILMHKKRKWKVI